MDSVAPPPQGNIDKGTAIIAATCVVVGVTVIVVALRLAIRVWITKSVWWDDWTILFAIVRFCPNSSARTNLTQDKTGNVIGAALDFVEVHYGFGRSQDYLTKWQLIEFKKYTYGEWIQTFATLMWTKVSICLFLLRIPVTKVLIRPLQAAIVFLLVSNVVLTILWIVQCRPIRAAWDTDVKGKCFSKGQLERIIIAQAIISVVSDYAFSAYPMLILWNVQMKVSHKIALCCLMGVGVFTGACCIVRTVLNYQSVPRDSTYGGLDNWFWRLFEVQIGIIAACTPALRPGYKWLRDKTQAHSRSKGHSPLGDEVHLQPVPATLGRSTPRAQPSRELSSYTTETYHPV